MRRVRVILGHSHVKRRHEPYRSDLPPSDVRNACMAAPSEAHQHPVGDRGHAIRLRERDNEGREKFDVLDAHGECVSRVWGRSAAESACRQLIEHGMITR